MIMQMFLGVEPPSPPPGRAAAQGRGRCSRGAKPTMRQQMEMHRKNEPCASCHKIMDPIGFSMENFDAIGRWRTTDDGKPDRSLGQLVDGTKLDGVVGLRDALLKYSPQFVRRDHREADDLRVWAAAPNTTTCRWCAPSCAKRRKAITSSRRWFWEW